MPEITQIRAIEHSGLVLYSDPAVTPSMMHLKLNGEVVWHGPMETDVTVGEFAKLKFDSIALHPEDFEHVAEAATFARLAEEHAVRQKQEGGDNG